MRLLATTTDLADLLDEAIDPGDARAAAAVAHASAVVAAYLPDWALPADAPVPDIARTVTVLVAADLHRNPQALDSATVNAQSGSWSYAQAPRLLTGDRRALLDTLTARSRPARPRIGTARLGFPWAPLPGLPARGVPRGPW